MSSTMPGMFLIARRMAAVALVIAIPTLQSGRTKTMNPDIRLYQFIHDREEIAIARISSLDIKPAPGGAKERVSVQFQVVENLAGPSSQTARSYVFDRPANEVTRLKFPDPVWGLVDFRVGALVFLVTPGPGLNAKQDPVYAESVAAPEDPVLRSVREILKTELKEPDTDRFNRRLQWLASGDTVHKLFAGEALAKNPVSQQQMASLVPAFARAFAEERDPYIKISLGSWLWGDIYPQVNDESGHIAIINASITAASSDSPNVRRFAIDRLSESDPKLLAEPEVRPTQAAISRLEERRSSESDNAARENLTRIIDALRR